MAVKADLLLSEDAAGVAMLKKGVARFNSHQLSGSSSRAHHLRTLAWLHLNPVNNGTHRHRAQTKAIAWLDISGIRCDDLVTRAEAGWCENISLLAVGV